MPTKTLSSPWLDRFECPSPQALLDPLADEFAPLAQDIRQRFLRFPNVQESVQWQGLPWRWCLAYTAPLCPPDRALAFLVPEPESTRVAVPLDEADASALLTSRSARCLRENLAQSSQVGSVLWLEWVLGSKVLVDELSKLIKAKLELTASANSRATSDN